MNRENDVRSDVSRFIVAGIFNTAVTIAIYQTALLWSTPGVAYVISWAVGVVFVGVTYPTRVFTGSQNGKHASAVVMVVYLIGFLSGLGVVRVVSDYFAAPKVAIFVAIVTTACFNFAMMRLMLRYKSPYR